MKNQIIKLILLLTLISQNLNAQKWIVTDSILVFPQGFSSWLQRNNGGVDPASPGPGNASGQIGNIGTNQGVDLYDFNRDGLPDLIFQLFPSNNVTREYLKGIFIQSKNGKFVLDTNFVIKAKGDMWLGGFGDFNGDGLSDYHYIIQNYHGADSNRKYSPEMINDNWPEKVFINNGKNFDTLTLDVDNLNVESTYVADIDKDGFDEIVATDRGPNFINIYKYNKIKNCFSRTNTDLTDLWKKRFTDWSGKKPHFNIAGVNNSNEFSFIVSDSSISKVINEPDWQPYNFQKFSYIKYNFITNKIDIITLNRDSIFIPGKYSTSNTDDYYKFVIHEKPTAFIIDIDKDGRDEIVVGGYYMNNYYKLGISRFSYGWKVLGLNGKDLTSQFFKDNGFDFNTELWAFNLDIDENNEEAELLPGTWGNHGGDLGSYYKIVNGKFEKYLIRNLQLTSGKKLDSTYFKQMNLITFPNYTNNKNGIVMYDFNDIKRTSIIYQASCKGIVKPTFSNTKFSFCTNDSLKLTINNVNKGDTLKWYFGTKSDLTNVANKTFTDSTKLYVTRTDSIGCMISSDTIQIKKYSIPTAPSLSRDAENNLVSNIIGITWYKDGVKIADTTQKIKPTSNGNYTATTTQNGCTSSASANYYYLTSAVANLTSGEYFKISPNPTNGEIYLNYNIRSTKDVYINVVDMSGRTIISNRKVTSGSKLNPGTTMKGNYIIQVKDKSGRLLTTEKLIKN